MVESDGGYNTDLFSDRVTRYGCTRLANRSMQRKLVNVPASFIESVW